MASPFKFTQHGQSGLYVSELFPNVAKHADDLCVLNGMHCDNPAHPQATIQLHTGNAHFVRPSMGSWVLYGLGTLNANLPGLHHDQPAVGLGGAQNYGGRLPARRVTRARASTATPAGAMPNLANPSLSTAAAAPAARPRAVDEPRPARPRRPERADRRADRVATSSASACSRPCRT